MVPYFGYVDFWSYPWKWQRPTWQLANPNHESPNLLLHCHWWPSWHLENGIGKFLHSRPLWGHPLCRMVLKNPIFFTCHLTSVENFIHHYHWESSDLDFVCCFCPCSIWISVSQLFQGVWNLVHGIWNLINPHYPFIHYLPHHPSYPSLCRAPRPSSRRIGYNPVGQFRPFYSLVQFHPIFRHSRLTFYLHGHCRFLFVFIHVLGLINNSIPIWYMKFVTPALNCLRISSKKDKEATTRRAYQLTFKWRSFCHTAQKVFTSSRTTWLQRIIIFTGI